jgi:hypothetical protein
MTGLTRRAAGGFGAERTHATAPLFGTFVLLSGSAQTNTY